MRNLKVLPQEGQLPPQAGLGSEEPVSKLHVGPEHGTLGGVIYNSSGQPVQHAKQHPGTFKARKA